MIVLYAVPLDVSNDKTSAQYANDVFGINVTEAADPVSGRSQMLRCSRGQLEYIPACGTEEQACFGEPLVVNGVMEVPIANNATGVASGTIVDWVATEAQGEYRCPSLHLLI